MPEPAIRVDSAEEVTNRILAHYAAHARDLPWRSPPGRAPPDPYSVWLSEVMLQQTTVAAVRPYHARFLARWPDFHALAAAADADVMSAWAGLGYYARARNLLACARAVTRDHDGRLPTEEAALLKLPGVGAYTAAAIAAIAFGKRAIVVDGNVERVIARLFAVEAIMPAAKPLLKKLTGQLTPGPKQAGDFAQAMMDLGATICTPRNPACAICPIMETCKGKGDAERYPVKPPKKAKPARHGTAWWIEHDQQVLLITRPEKGLLGGMSALPSCSWEDDGTAPPFAADWDNVGTVSHVFTHFSLTLTILHCAGTQDMAEKLCGRWWPIDRIGEAGLPSLFAKAAQRALARGE